MFQFQILFRNAIFCVAVGSFISPTTSLAQNANPPLQNSTRKIRVQPSAQSQRIGSAIHWQPDFASAVAQSQKTGKPIFWYVPTLRGTFMDRKSEIDRYMMAGPFSWPTIIAALNEQYVPIKIAPSQKQQTKYDLVPYKFIEPGFVILNSDGSEKLKTDRLTTLHVEWFRQLLANNANHPLPKVNRSTAAEPYSKGNFEAVLQQLNNSPNNTCQDKFFRGMSLFRLGRHNDAKMVWENMSKAYPDEPLAWKAAAEAQGIGPFVRGFEVHRKLPAKVLKFDYKLAGSAAPVNTYTEAQLWENSTQFLLGMQNEDGGFNDSDYDYGGTDSLPNVHVAVTSIAGMALIRTLERNEIEPAIRARIIKAINKAIAYVSNEKNINQADKDEILWAYAYRLRFLIRAKKQNSTLKNVEPSLDLQIKQAVAGLESIQSRRGGWYHEYNNP
ncbi:MAG: hypothetical protein P8J27_08540, partial [Mariniblastus sp.]|nr:hypothetical protein [Mariniblastus sp.]